MNKIVYSQSGKEILDELKPLWEKTRDHHAAVSLHFSMMLKQLQFKERIAEFDEKSVNVAIATDAVAHMIIGYCIASVDKDDKGTIESLYVEPEYRNGGIASSLMQQSLNWMDSKGVKAKMLTVAVGNDDVLVFYQKFGFLPFQHKLMQK